ncbi:MAG: hypothetical protein WD638_01750 [Nitriliruptoraceae bacterium]
MRIRDVSRAGHELGSAELHDLPPRITLRVLLAARIRAEVAAYNVDPGPTYVGVVQPEGSIRYSYGHRVGAPRVLDADRFVAAFEQAVTAGLARVAIDGDPASDDLDRMIDTGEVAEVTVVLERGIVARDP